MNKQGKILTFAVLILVAVAVMGFVLAKGPKACNNNQDDDGDGYTDWPDDPGCSHKQDNNELGTTACDDGNDNDGDGYSDMNDPGCTSPSDTSEYGTAQCDDGSDNDGDGYSDMNDAGCSSLTDDDETNCGDGAVSGSEVCDGTNLDGETCSRQGYSGGTLSCNAQCDGFVTSGCYTNTCSETDYGWMDLGNVGTNSGDYLGSPYSHTDYCLDSVNLVEYGCSGGHAYSNQFACNNQTNWTSCSNGACVA